MRDPRKVRATKAKEVIQGCGLTVAQLARDAGLSEASLWAWLKGRRVPSPESLEQLAVGLRERGEVLDRHADMLQKVARLQGEKKE